MRLGADGADAEVPADAGAALRGADRAARTAAQPAGGDGAQTPRCAEGTVPQGNAVAGQVTVGHRTGDRSLSRTTPATIMRTPLCPTTSISFFMQKMTRSVTSSSALPHHTCIMNSPHGMNTLAERTSFPCAMSMSYLAESV